MEPRHYFLDLWFCLLMERFKRQRWCISYTTRYRSPCEYSSSGFGKRDGREKGKDEKWLVVLCYCNEGACDERYDAACRLFLLLEISTIVLVKSGALLVFALLLSFVLVGFGIHLVPGRWSSRETLFGAPASFPWHNTTSSVRQTHSAYYCRWRFLLKEFKFYPSIIYESDPGFGLGWAGLLDISFGSLPSSPSTFVQTRTLIFTFDFQGTCRAFFCAFVDFTLIFLLHIRLLSTFTRLVLTSYIFVRHSST